MGLFDKVKRGFNLALGAVTGSFSNAAQKIVNKSRFELKWYGKQRQAEVERELEKRLALIGAVFTGYLKVRLSVPVDYGARPPIRSKPGEYPRMDTGKLKRSIRWKLGGPSSDRFVAIRAGAPYASKLENQMGRKLLGAAYDDQFAFIRRTLLAPGYLKRGTKSIGIGK